MKKIGILTHYYKSTNYGANLQAYALVKFLINSGYDTEQICYTLVKSLNTNNSIISKICRFPYKKFYKIPYKLLTNLLEKREVKRHDFTSRKRKAFYKFNSEIIPHTKEVYCFGDLTNTINDYDVFIVGSDQVWNMDWYIEGFYLGFVPSEKIKLSYAASFGSTRNLKENSQLIKNYLNDYKAISVREQSAVEFLAGLGLQSQLSCDPTLLLNRKDWDMLASSRLIEEDYVFCYFLGENRRSREIAKKYARKHNLKLVNIPHADGWFRLHDIKFAEEQLFDATPNDFISLIKHAKYVFTDSFHAVVFSNIYHKQYFVFNRNKTGDMNTRIFNIIELFNQEERFCYGKNQSLKYVEDLSDIDYTRDNSKFEKLKKDSIQFLLDNINSDDINKQGINND